MSRDTGLGLSDAVVEESPSELGLQHLSASDAESIRELVSQFPEVFTSKLGLTHLLEYDISLKDTQPDRLPHCRLSLHLRLIISEASFTTCSPYSSPMLLVAKGEGDFRPIVDYRLLNQKINIESVALPDIQSAFNWFRGATVFTSLDLIPRITRSLSVSSPAP